MAAQGRDRRRRADRRLRRSRRRQSPTIANLRSQYAQARKRYAELTTELGPPHPALKQMEQQVGDLRRTIAEEIDRFEQSARNDLTRARDYEASLNRALDAQKRQSVRLSQASVRLRELEREVDASREVYQAFLKRSRETEEQESLNTSAARIVGEATVPLRRSFLPAMRPKPPMPAPERDDIPGPPARPSALSDLGQWRGAVALLDRADDGAAVPQRGPDQCRRTAAGRNLAVQIEDAVAGARRHHRPVRRGRGQGRNGRANLLPVRRQ